MADEGESKARYTFPRTRILMAVRGVIMPEELVNQDMVENLFNQYMKTEPTEEEVQALVSSLREEVFDAFTHENTPDLLIEGDELDDLLFVQKLGAHIAVDADMEPSIFLQLSATRAGEEEGTQYQFVLPMEAARNLLHTLFHLFL